MRRYEGFTLHTLLQGFQVSDCDWLLSANVVKATQHKAPPSESLKQLEVLQEFVYWYFDSFLIPLLKVGFR